MACNDSWISTAQNYTVEPIKVVIRRLEYNVAAHCGVKMLCFRCGECCVRYHVQLSLSEAGLIAERMGLSLEAWQEQFTDPGWPGGDSLLLRHLNGECVFLVRTGEKLTRCLIQTFKPASCREWKADPSQRECREGLAKYWGLSVDPQGEIEGPAEKVSSFMSFVASLEEGS
ncbi:MAG: YkgJ family cysteine cluster protein [Chloroflexota bacterium]